MQWCELSMESFLSACTFCETIGKHGVKVRSIHHYSTIVTTCTRATHSLSIISNQLQFIDTRLERHSFIFMIAYHLFIIFLFELLGPFGPDCCLLQLFTILPYQISTETSRAVQLRFLFVRFRSFSWSIMCQIESERLPESAKNGWCNHTKVLLFFFRSFIVIFLEIASKFVEFILGCRINQ